jgi:hypothetical protein
MKRPFFILLAVALLFSCQKPGGTPVASDTNTVTITVKKSAMTRASLGGAVEAGAITDLTDAMFFFFDADENTTLYHYFTVGESETFTGQITIEGIPSNSTHVTMIGNVGDMGDDAADILTLDDFAALTLDIDSQASMADGAGGGGSPAAVQGIALVDGNGGSGNLLSGPDADPDDTSDDNIRTASITLTPAVARIEIAAGAIELDTDPVSANRIPLTSFDLGGIYVNGYYATRTLSGASTDRVNQTEVTGATIWHEAYLDLEPSEYLYDETEGTVVTEAYAGGFAYHVFPGTTPHIIIRADNLLYEGAPEDNPDDGPHYWIVEEFLQAGTNNTIGSLEAGHVYRIESIVVGETIPRPGDPYDNEVSVRVTVTILPWEVEYVDVTPR